MEWGSTALVQNPLRYGLVFDQAGAKQALREFGGPKDFVFDDWATGNQARIAWFGPGSIDNNALTSTALVCIHPDLHKKTAIEIAAVLVHEAVHIWQRVCLCLNETTPSDEFEAYSIQWISQNLMFQYAEWLKS